MLVPVITVPCMPMASVFIVDVIVVADVLVPARFLGVNVDVLALVLSADLGLHGDGTSCDPGRHTACLLGVDGPAGMLVRRTCSPACGRNSHCPIDASGVRLEVPIVRMEQV
jgi:hypothetical protein